MERLPCIDCIAFPMCRVRYNNTDSIFRRYRITQECPLLCEYIFNQGDSDIVDIRSGHFHGYFKGVF